MRVHSSLPVLREFPDTPDDPYVVQMPRKPGELILAELAATQPREFMWEFQEDTQHWLHIPGENVVTTAEREGKIVAVSVGMTVPYPNDFASSRNSAFYHIHPRSTAVQRDSPYPDAAEKVLNQLPSDPDIAASVRLAARGGYRDFRIVTDIGTTALTFDAQTFIQSGQPGINLSVYRPSHTDMMEYTGTPVQTIEDIVVTQNNYFDPLLRISFRPHVSSSIDDL
jgi:hypothetical protein